MTIEERLKFELGNLLFANVARMQQIEDLQAEVEKLKKERTDGSADPQNPA